MLHAKYSSFILPMVLLPALAHADFSIEEAPSISPAQVTAQAEASEAATDAVVVRTAPAVIETWDVSPNDVTVRRVLAKWAARAGWQLAWEASVDVPVTVSASFPGDFRKAITSLFSSLSATDVNLSALLYKDNRVLRVTEAGQRAQ